MEGIKIASLIAKRWKDIHIRFRPSHILAIKRRILLKEGISDNEFLLYILKRAPRWEYDINRKINY